MMKKLNFSVKRAMKFFKQDKLSEDTCHVFIQDSLLVMLRNSNVETKEGLTESF